MYQLELIYPQIDYGGRKEDFFYDSTFKSDGRGPIYFYISKPSGHLVGRDTLETLMEAQWANQ